MKVILSLLAVVSLFTALPLEAEERGESEILQVTTAHENEGYMMGAYNALSIGTPGVLNLHIGYMDEKAGVSFSTSALAVAAPATLFCNMFILMESGDWNDDDFLRYFLYFSGQGNFFINISRGQDYIFSVSIFGGGVYYTLEDEGDKVAMVYGGVAVNWFYRNFFLEVGIAYTYNYIEKTFLKKYPVLPLVQIGYIYRY